MIPIGQAEFITTAVKPSGYPPPGPPEVAFAGRSNVGKSSLINTLTRRKKLVRVSGTPGRTQHINFFSINQDAIRLVDLPGYGYAKVPKAIRAAWRPMVEAYLSGRDTLAAVVVILDIRREPTGEDLMLLDWLRSLQITVLAAVTKADKLSNNQQASRLAKLRPTLAPFDPTPTLFSASTGQGREELWARVCEAAGV
ncbi:ribosome biogenesis GTP-binding protein YihA/YsxC [Desulfoferula mesophila]|uniref:Probable GTP-binding protein EngB n=1 Tax=Desulfoferula mesophila TaxID=3058419 RepID=A0AAU9EJB0_9BACT|nr:putative GTP-binding protein EngB [Desulfoferula mesophilus]